jgi:glycosyltransferase involved in cell wall biosynthesis
MRVLMLSQDMNMFEERAVTLRMALFGEIFEETLLVVFGAGERREKMLAPNVVAVAPGGKNKIHAFSLGVRELLKETREHKYSVLSSQDPFFLGVAAVFVSRKRRIPLQVQLHADCFSPAFIRESLRRRVEATLARLVLKRASCVRAVSKRVAERVRSVTSVPVSVFPILVEDSRKSDFPKPAVFRDKFTLLAVSRLTREKQIHVLIDAALRVPETDLIIVGEGPLRKSLELRVKKGGGEDRIRFAGYQDPAPFYAHANLFMQASLHEGYGLTLIEAALAGLPIITTDVGVVGEVLHNTVEAIVVEGSSESFANAIGRVREDKVLGEILGQSAHVAALKTLLSKDEYLLRYKRALESCRA